MDDLELVERARRGAMPAFGALVDRHRGAVYRTAMAALSIHEEAEDVAQETFLIAFQRLDQFRGDASFKTWLLRIAWRLALTARRRGTWRSWIAGWSRRESADVQEGRWDPPDTARSPEAQTLDAERLAVVRRVVAALPARYRDPLLLLATGDQSYEEIAKVLGTSVGTLKWRVSEGRKQLRARLAHLGYDDV